MDMSDTSHVLGTRRSRFVGGALSIRVLIPSLFSLHCPHTYVSHLYAHTFSLISGYISLLRQSSIFDYILFTYAYALEEEC
jgi:hypothetical protein